LLSIVALSALLVAVPALAAATSRVLDPRVTNASLAVSVALLVVLLRPRVEPWVQRTLFRERAALERGALALRQELTRTEKPSELLALLGDRLTSLLRPVCTAIYGCGESELAPVFVRGPAAAPSFDAGRSLAALLSAQRAPLRLPRRRRDPLWRQLDADESAALEGMGAAVLAPVRHKGALSAFLCLGEKESGDVYTETDLALIGSVVDKASDELERFEERSLYEAEREMNSRLRQYVPGAVAEELESGEPARASQREVTVLFVDVRGYTALVEGRRPHEIFEIVSSYTRAVSAAVADAAGTIVEFNGDGMMAVFGAPRAVADKEAAAIRAARAIRAGLAALSLPDRGAGAERLEVGIGIATGPAFVGSIQSADRAIWTALGNTTNLASRLQTMTREHAAAIAIDELTHQRAGRTAQGFQSLGIVPIRGRTDPIEVFVSSNEEGRR
jgi:class 3 adenylate cyclase